MKGGQIDPQVLTNKGCDRIPPDKPSTSETCYTTNILHYENAFKTCGVLNATIHKVSNFDITKK